MSWSEALLQLDANGVVEFGIHQMDEKTGSPRWRRHRGGPNFRFASVRAALFSPSKGARAACLGKSTYARDQYSATAACAVPYVAVWLQGADLAFLARASAANPEVSLVPVAAVEEIESAEHGELLAQLARLFGEGAQLHGVRHLSREAVQSV